MLNDKLKQRLRRDRPSVSITLRIPQDVVDTLKELAPRLGMSGYQTLLKSYISEGLRRDEARMVGVSGQKLIAALRRHGVSAKVLDAALHDLEKAA
ncbi:MAG TPA: hypothetical protein VHE37_14245 [Nevskiaceae bacterium]|nr:hypothetical protein [Nevskiaceae bacterium]